MSNSKTGSKLAQNLRRAKGQQNSTEETAVDNKKPATKAKTTAKKAPAKPAAKPADTSSFVESSRVWPD